MKKQNHIKRHIPELKNNYIISPSSFRQKQSNRQKRTFSDIRKDTKHKNKRTLFLTARSLSLLLFLREIEKWLADPKADLGHPILHSGNRTLEHLVTDLSGPH